MIIGCKFEVRRKRQQGPSTRKIPKGILRMRFFPWSFEEGHDAKVIPFTCCVCLGERKSGWQLDLVFMKSSS
jgi:hypothetical protein